MNNQDFVQPSFGDLPGVAIDEAAFKVIFEKNYALLCRYTGAIINDAEAAKDITADLFCYLWDRRERLSIQQDPQHYLLIAARNAAFRWLKKQRKETFLSSLYNNEAGQNDVDKSTPLSSLVQKENTHALQNLLEKLTPVRREIIHYRLAGLTVREVALVLRLTEKKVEYQLKQAITDLRASNLAQQLQPEAALLLINLIFLLR